MGYVARTLGNIKLAEDLVQEAFLQLFRELKAGSKIEHPKGWTLCVVRHQMFPQERRKYLKRFDGKAQHYEVSSVQFLNTERRQE